MRTLFTGARKLDADGVSEDFWMLTDGDHITATGVGEAPPALRDATDSVRVDLAGDWLTPGFIDLHVHGGGGFTAEGSVGDMAAIRAMHLAHGTTRSLLSLVSHPLESLTASLGRIAELTATDPTVLGAHLEGPFLAPARRGAHDERHLIAPSAEIAKDLIDAAGGTLRYVTIAPEIDNALETITQFRSSGVVVGVGHTEADFDLTREAFARGATVLTHAFNAMPGIHHRNPGPVVAAIADTSVILELVLDGTHVHPDVVAMTFRSAPDRIALVTDAMAAAGAGDGRYQLGSLSVDVTNGVARVAARAGSVIAGSTLTQDRALRIAIDRAGLSPRDAITALTLTPARTLGIDDELGRLAVGYVADVVRFTREWQVRDVWVAGARVSASAIPREH